MRARAYEYELTGAEADELRGLAKTLADAPHDPVHPGFYDHCWTAAGQLPRGLREFLEGLRRGERAAVCVVRGFPADDDALGPTPAHWDAAEPGRPTLELELWLALSGLTLGEPFAWASLQSGRVVQNILPIRGDEKRQNGYGSKAFLEFHTEDGFHPLRCDYLLLMGVRNHDQVPTIVSSVRDLHLTEADRVLLAQERFYILPDDEHVRQLQTHDPDNPALERMRRMRDDPQPMAVLFGDARHPYLRIDRPFMRAVGGDPRAEAALDRLMAELERAQQEVVVGPGTLLVVDNYLAVHGRRSFEVRYDGTDRWLKKLTVSRNLRRGLTFGAADFRIVQ
ncbi:TauD/TfdA family dioxygenase [Actinocrinis puniceicyclus]|uniref:TauD/TfdA family dioxygenase n=1 Tax=Actinocrinis puniceicyclus TaxID=977794 RepID=A0A8J8BD94_9ACTN|nr:guanitoxin biosynthesis L-enduracididine beta-hydroxylase GntD [Actinocrinis puniceicyclus]MBS2965018.1 TauD/TfdA family dioxygenase [Actinocrinis puniceicyclus]